MLDRPPSMLLWIVLAAASGVCVEMARRSGPEDFQSLFLVLAAVLAVAAGLCALDWLLYKAGGQIRMVYEIRATTERVKVIQAIGALNDRQIAYLETSTPAVILLPGEFGPVRLYLRVNGVQIPYDFIDLFIKMADDIHLASINTWSDGSQNREWARLLTIHLVSQGFAEQHNGNKAAKWLNKPKALVWLGIEET